MSRTLELVEPILRYLPEISRPKRRISFKGKLLWSFLALTTYLVMSQIPLYGIVERQMIAEFLFMNIIFAARSGFLTQLGIGPIVTAGIVMQILVGSKLIEVDMSDPRQRALFTGAQKLLTIVITAVEAVAFIAAGFFGPLSPKGQVAVFLQLLAAGIVIMLLDELVQSGWGLGSGVSLFILGGVAQQVFWGLFSPIPVPEREGEPLGAIPALIHLAVKGNALGAFNRYPLPDMTGLVAMVAVLLIVLYFENMRVEVPVSYAKYRGLRANVPLKFLYVSVIPIIFAGALYANLQLFAQMVWSRWNTDNSNLFLNLLGTFNMTDQGPVPTGGLVYFLSPPRGLGALQSPDGIVHLAIYAALLCLLCVLFAYIWVAASGMSAKDQAESLIRAGLQVPGFRQSPKVLEKLLQRYISALTVLSGLFIGLLAVFADLLGAIGTGTGILLSVSILYQYYQIMARERAIEMYPLLERVLGER
ncbi:MAG: preprotein translocase subunit SecY [Candidatus Nezhaarchaeota archaeon]|nr:preprotein translocase subunit SecY [Candidatus Nezhaarchaeota archaeon]